MVEYVCLLLAKSDEEGVVLIRVLIGCSSLHELSCAFLKVALPVCLRRYCTALCPTGVVGKLETSTKVH